MSDDGSKGNVVLGLSSSTLLMVDIDYAEEEMVIAFTEQYAKHYDLGSVLVMLTSHDGQMTIDGKSLRKFAVIFGKSITTFETQWHIKQIRGLGMCERKFLAMRKISYATVRVNGKNNRISSPTVVAFYPNGDLTGVKYYLQYWEMCKNLGRAKQVKQKNPLSSEMTLVKNVRDEHG